MEVVDPQYRIDLRHTVAADERTYERFYPTSDGTAHLIFAHRREPSWFRRVILGAPGTRRMVYRDMV